MKDGAVAAPAAVTAAGAALDLAGRSVIVTGACGDIGAGYVAAFAAAGANVVAVDLPAAAGTGGDLAAEVTWTGPGRAVFVPGDVTSDEDWRTVVGRAVADFGRLDALVNNAAVYRAITRKRPLEDLTVDDWDRILAVNVRGTWQGIKAAVPAMTASGCGRIVNVSSVVTRTGAAGFAHYVASKAAVEGLTRAAARELGPRNIGVNAVAPGLVDTPSSRALNTGEYLAAAAGGRCLPRAMRPDDLVGAVLWLASPAAGFVTGQTVVVDGGHIFA